MEPYAQPARPNRVVYHKDERRKRETEMEIEIKQRQPTYTLREREREYAQKEEDYIPIQRLQNMLCENLIYIALRCL